MFPRHGRRKGEECRRRRSLRRRDERLLRAIASWRDSSGNRQIASPSLRNWLRLGQRGGNLLVVDRGLADWLVEHEVEDFLRDRRIPHRREGLAVERRWAMLSQGRDVMRRAVSLVGREAVHGKH